MVIGLDRSGKRVIRTENGELKILSERKQEEEPTQERKPESEGEVQQRPGGELKHAKEKRKGERYDHCVWEI